jgi:hypothetical protein
MDVLTLIPGVGQLLFFIGSGMDFFLQGMYHLWNVKKMNNAIRLQNANWQGEWNSKQRLNILMQKREDIKNKAKKDLADREKAIREY